MLAVIEETPFLSVAELARRCCLTPQSANDLLKRLSKGGLVGRRQSEHNMRIVEVFLTGLGRKTIRKAHAAVRVVDVDMLTGVLPSDRRLMARLFEKTISNLRNDGQPKDNVEALVDLATSKSLVDIPPQEKKKSNTSNWPR